MVMDNLDVWPFSAKRFGVREEKEGTNYRLLGDTVSNKVNTWAFQVVKMSA